MRKYYKAKIKEIQRMTSGAVKVIFDLGENRSYFDFLPGQFISLKKEINGEDIRRSYSLCTAPYENEYSVIVKKVEDGVFSTYANEKLQVGEEIELMPPEGRFSVQTDSTLKRTFVFVAAGSGITPVISNIKAVLKEEPHSHVILLYGNTSTRDIIFKEELEGLKNKFFQRVTIHYFLSREAIESPLHSGRINAEKCKVLSRINPVFLHADSYHICGPIQMVEELSEYLEANGVEKARIHFELFGVPTPLANSRKNKISEHAVKSKVKITLSGLETSIDFAENDDNILDAALAQGMDLPYACKGGVCSTCKAKVLSGQVEMAVNYALEPDEIENNIVLTCQSIPTTEKVEIDFDIAG